MELTQYGIQNEKSHIRCHVCPASKSVYVYQTQAALEAIKNTSYKKVEVKTDGIVTAQGLLVPAGDISDVRRIPIADDIWEKLDIKSTDSTSSKGRKAQDLVTKLIKRGRFPFWLSPIPITNLKLQYEGVDLMVVAKKRIQVKCDLSGGDRKYGGSGNLFLQTAEKNLYKQY